MSDGINGAAVRLLCFSSLRLRVAGADEEDADEAAEEEVTEDEDATALEDDALEEEAGVELTVLLVTRNSRVVSSNSASSWEGGKETYDEAWTLEDATFEELLTTELETRLEEATVLEMTEELGEDQAKGELERCLPRKAVKEGKGSRRGSGGAVDGDLHEAHIFS